MGTEPLDDQPLGSPIGLGYQVELALEFERHAPLEVVRQQRAGFARNVDGRLEIRHPGRLALFLDVFDIVLEDEEVRFAVAGEADERLVVIFNHAGHLFTVLHPDTDAGVGLNQLLEILRLLECLLGGARRFSLLWRTQSPTVSWCVPDSRICGLAASRLRPLSPHNSRCARRPANPRISRELRANETGSSREARLADRIP